MNDSPLVDITPRVFIIRGRFLADVQNRRFLNFLKITKKPYKSMKSLFLMIILGSILLKHVLKTYSKIRNTLNISEIPISKYNSLCHFI